MSLYIVATPIGNLDDLCARARNTLREADLVACEDTRVTGSMLDRFGIVPKLVSLHEHSGEERISEVIEQALSGDVAYVSDAGTPGVSDPGVELLEQAYRNGVEVSPIPGPSAVTTALSLAPFGRREFRFLGFLPKKEKARGEMFERLRRLRESCVWFTSPNRVHDDLRQLTGVVQAERRLLVCRELTKQHEDIRLATVGEWGREVSELPERGEYTLVLESAGDLDDPPLEVERETLFSLGEELVEAGISPRSAVELIAGIAPEIKGKLRSELYN